RPLLGGAPWAAHDDVAFLDELARVRMPVRLRLDAAARIAFDVERVDVALLLRGAATVAPLQPSAKLHAGRVAATSRHETFSTALPRRLPRPGRGRRRTVADAGPERPARRLSTGGSSRPPTR